MYRTLEQCKRAWVDAGQHGDRQTRVARNRLWARYYAHLAGEGEDGPARIDAQARDAVDRLIAAGRLKPRDTVLDIGAGTGTYALALAGRCQSVTALDMDPASLSALGARAAALGLNNIELVQGMWEEFSPGKKFSLTFSALCPAVCDYDELVKMEAMAARACCLVAAARGSIDPHRKNLMALLDVKPAGGMTTEAIWYYDMLYLMGRRPDVFNWTVERACDLPLEQACRRGAVYFEIFGVPRAQSESVLRRYYKQHAQNGLVREEVRINLAMLAWDVPGAGA